MMKRRVDALTEKKRELYRRNREVRKLARDLDKLVDRHNAYRVGGGTQNVIEWFESFPIESLRESLDYEYEKPRQKLSLPDLVAKGNVRREHCKKEELLEIAESKRAVAQIDVLLEKIGQILTHTE